MGGCVEIPGLISGFNSDQTPLEFKQCKRHKSSAAVASRVEEKVDRRFIPVQPMMIFMNRETFVGMSSSS